MIVHRADRFGLAQLYQLRGRVGRSKTRAYAYMVTPPERQMTDTARSGSRCCRPRLARRRVSARQHDLDIRGRRQPARATSSRGTSGGRLRTLPVDARRGDHGRQGRRARQPPARFSPQITVDAPILIPDDYVPDLDLRMGLYRRLNDLDQQQDVEAFAAEMIDRFGPLPDATENLIRVIEIKLNAKRACISKMDVGAKGVVVSFHDNKPPNVDGLIAYVARLNGQAKLRPDSKFVLNRAWPDAKARLHGALQLSKGLAKTAG
jgi:transcription-repair coupling factor (superfamily II helicase)